MTIVIQDAWANKNSLTLFPAPLRTAVYRTVWYSQNLLRVADTPMHYSCRSEVPVCPQPTADSIFRNRHDFSFAEKLYGTQPIVPPTCNSQTDKNGASIFEDICLVNYQTISVEVQADGNGACHRFHLPAPSHTKDHHLKSTCFCTHKMSLIPFNIRTSDSGLRGTNPSNTSFQGLYSAVEIVAKAVSFHCT